MQKTSPGARSTTEHLPGVSLITHSGRLPDPASTTQRNTAQLKAIHTGDSGQHRSCSCSSSLSELRLHYALLHQMRLIA
jgi:hypothetical protein